MKSPTQGKFAVSLIVMTPYIMALLMQTMRLFFISVPNPHSVQCQVSSIDFEWNWMDPVRGCLRNASISDMSPSLVEV